MYNLNSNIKIGDILLIKGSAKHSKIIAKVTKGSFSHACLVVGETQIIEALGSSGVQYSSTSRFVFENLENVKVLRPKFKNEIMASAQREGIEDIAHEYQSRGYNLIDALKSVFGTKTPITTDKYFCSQLIAHIFHRVNFPITDKLIHNVTPNDFLKSSVLKNITSNVVTLIPNHVRERLAERNMSLNPIDDGGKTNSLNASLFRELIKKSRNIFTEYNLTPAVRMFDIIEILTNPLHSDISVELDRKITKLYDSLKIIEQLSKQTNNDYDDSEQFKEEIKGYDFELATYELLSTQQSLVNMKKRLNETKNHEMIFHNCYKSLNLTYANRLSKYYHFIAKNIEWIITIHEKDEKNLINHLNSLNNNFTHD